MPPCLVLPLTPALAAPSPWGAFWVFGGPPRINTTDTQILLSRQSLTEDEKARFGLSAAEDLTPRLRAAFERQAVALTLQEDGASLTLSGGPSELTFDLFKVPGPEAAPRLQALTLGLAKRVCSLEQRLAAAEETAASPRKSPRPSGRQLFLPDPEPQRGGPGPGIRRRCPGESLINPG
ncbi:protein PAXX, partial [Carlito syrichta]|uniref:Protein PAXX n=1 Tax=Carlito syrichta TaxID=1868482 RepID=A0A1U7UYL0_CARSF